MKKIVIGADHAGYKMKEKIKAKLGDRYIFLDMGADSEIPGDDYPKYAEWVATLVANDPSLLGVLICGSGVGVSIVANKIPGARAALAFSVKEAEMSRKDDHANIVATAGREKTMDDPVQIVKAFLETPVSREERHLRRVQMIKKIEERNRR